MKRKTQKDVISDLKKELYFSKVQIAKLNVDNLYYKNKISDLVKLNREHNDILKVISELTFLLTQNSQLSRVAVDKIIGNILELSSKD